MPGISAVSPPISAQPGLPAAFSDSRHDGRRCLRGQTAGREVIQEKQRFCPLNHQVIHAHRHQIDSDGIVLVRIDCYFQLGADAVRRCDQHRIIVTGSFRVEQPAKPA